MFCFNCGYNLEEIGMGYWECPRCENRFLPYQEDGDQCMKMLESDKKPATDIHTPADEVSPPEEKIGYELSENQKKFVADAKTRGYELRWNYSGRGMYGEECPAVVVSSIGEFSTDATTSSDQMGKGFVIYAEE